MALTQKDLHEATCQAPGCDGHGDAGGIYFHAKCHPHSPTWTKYLHDGTIIVECAECENTIVTIKVAP